MNILLVDDEELLLLSLLRRVQQLLPEADCHAFTSTDEALQFAENNKPDIAFLDIRMQALNGISMAKMLHDLYPRINIIFCTGYDEYAMDAHNLYCSAYLMKPIRTEELRKALNNLRYPIEEQHSPVHIQCFGDFDIYFNGDPIHFKYSKTKELLAYLVDKNGARCSQKALNAALFGDEDHYSYYRQLKRDLIDTFEKLGMPEVIRNDYGALSIDRSKVTCDYFDYLDGKRTDKPEEYMQQYSYLFY